MTSEQKGRGVKKCSKRANRMDFAGVTYVSHIIAIDVPQCASFNQRCRGRTAPMLNPMFPTAVTSMVA